MERHTAKILGFNVDLFSQEEAILYIKERLANNIGAHVITINPEMIEAAPKNQKYSSLIKNADLLIPDGVGIKLALKINGINQEQIPGIEFAKKIIEICEKNNYPIALIGAKEEVITNTAAKLLEEYPNLKIIYKRNGYFTEVDEEEIIKNVEKSRAKLVLVGLGAPKQDYFINKCKNTVNNAIYIGVGGSFDVWSGMVKRAPVFYRKIGCEWLYRTIKEPYRFKRIFPTLPLFLFKVIIENIKNRLNNGQNTHSDRN